jgi:toxin-antitoxin system PIN domain toxin
VRALLDANVLIALIDPDHSFHNRAHEWWQLNSVSGWASCPLTENGCVRIMSNPAYSKKMQFTPSDLMGKVRTFAQNSDHEFWPDDLSLLDDKTFASERIHRGSQITDFYLLALATKRVACLATFDTNIPLSAVRGATAANLLAV